MSSNYLLILQISDSEERIDTDIVQTAKSQWRRRSQSASKLTLEGGFHGKSLPTHPLCPDQGHVKSKTFPFTKIGTKIGLVIRT